MTENHTDSYVVPILWLGLIGRAINLVQPGIGINHQRDAGERWKLRKGDVGRLIVARIALMRPFLAVKLEKGIGDGLGLGNGSGLMDLNTLLGIGFIKSLYKRFKIGTVGWTDDQLHPQVHPEAHKGRGKICCLT
jgi:hypothetical protein